MPRASGEPAGRSLRHRGFDTGGIGLALAHELAALDATTIVLGCRNLSKCELVRPVDARCVQLDLADLQSVVQFAGELLCQKLGPSRFGQNGAVQAFTSARGCPERHLGTASLGQLAAWAALAGHTGLVSHTGEVRSSVPRIDFLVHNAGFLADGLLDPKTAQVCHTGLEP